MRVCIFEGCLRVACSLLYPIFKFGKISERIPRESVYFWCAKNSHLNNKNHEKTNFIYFAIHTNFHRV